MESQEEEPDKVGLPTIIIAVLLGIVLVLVAVSAGPNFLIVALVFFGFTIAAMALLVVSRLVARQPPFTRPSLLFWIVVEVATLLVAADQIWESGLSTGYE